ncbi:transposase IS408 [Mesorhizobium sp. L48C026A00]|nr:transposase IS408 [Mesorhizobium sp. L48C026A00]
MRQEHAAGDKVFVDYSGKKIPIVDRKTGEIREAEIFVAVLGASSYTFAEATWTQTLPDWIGSHVRMFRFFHGVPRLVIPDNLKSGVSRASFYDPEINRSYGMMASHYGVGVLPARPRKPRDKSKVENGVRFAQSCILGRLRNQTFFSLAEANAAIAQALDRINDHVMRRLGVSRRQLFETVERPALASLPLEDYEFAEWRNDHVMRRLGVSRRQLFETVERPALASLPLEDYEFAEWRLARVSTDYHVEFKTFFYSVPHSLIRQQVDLRATARTIEIFHRGKRVAVHQRRYGGPRHGTDPDHMPSSHWRYAEWTPERFRRWATSIGPQTEGLVIAILASRPHPEQGFRTCLGILRRVAVHQRRYGGPRHGTDPDHMPSSHRRYAEWTPERFRRWATSIGPQTEGLVIAILASRPHPEQGFRTCLGILRLFRDIDRNRAEAVSARAVEIGGLNCKSIASLIANHKAARHSTEPTAIVDHANLRGPDYFH